MKTITNRQLVFLLFLTLAGTSCINLPRVLNESSGASGWVFLMGLSIFFAIGYALMVKVNLMHEGETLFEYGPRLMGKFLLYLLMGVLVLYGFGKTAVLSTNISLLVKYGFLPRTPLVVLIVTMCLASVFLAYKGTLVTGRVLEIYGVLELIFFITVIVLILFQGDWDYLRPFFDTERMATGWKESGQMLNAFAGAEVLLMIPLSGKINGKKAPKITFFTVLGTAAILSMLCLTTLMVIGPNALSHFEYPLVVAIRRLNIEYMPFLSRMDAFFITIGLAGFYCSLGVAFLFLVEILCKVFSRVRRGWVVTATAVTTVICGWIIYTTNLVNQVNDVINNYSTIAVSLILPIILFILTKVKKSEKNSA